VNIHFMEYSLVADHWQYAATIVPCAMFAAAAAMLGRRFWHRPAGHVLCLALLAVLAGLTWQQSRMYADVETLFRTTIDKNPDCCMARNNLGIVLLDRGQFDEAITQCGKAVELDPRDADYHYNFANALGREGRSDEAIAQFQKALELKPAFAESRNNLGLALAQRGEFDQAITHFRKALKLKPDFAGPRTNLGIAQSQRDKILNALAERRELLRSRPTDVSLLNDTAWVLATNPNASIRNGMEAVELVQRAVELSDGREPAILGTLAAAYAETGQFPEAVQTARKALELATQQNQQSLAESIKAKIHLYETGTPFRELQQSPLPPSGHP
jgi:protein O-mannosyl-transferase